MEVPSSRAVWGRAVPQPGPGCSEPLQRQRQSTWGRAESPAFIPVLMGDTQMLFYVPFCTAVRSLSVTEKSLFLQLCPWIGVLMEQLCRRRKHF